MTTMAEIAQKHAASFVESRTGNASACFRCGKNPRRTNRRGRVMSYCLTCHAAYARAWRSVNPMTPEQRMKDSARSIAGVYKRRGKLIPAPCEKCGTAKTEMHHDDYAKPLDVRWLCRPCHLDHHATPGAA